MLMEGKENVYSDISAGFCGPSFNEIREYFMSRFTENTP
jgi:hypothetical protein